MTELSVLERVRAAVAEAGYDPSVVIPDPAGEDPYAWLVRDVPEEVMWRARETVGTGRPLCLRCCLANRLGKIAAGCLADHRFVEDCGRDRGEP